MSEWIEWGGGECPLPHGVKHEVKFRNGTVINDDAPDGWSWGHVGEDDDIIAYRVIGAINDNAPATELATATQYTPWGERPLSPRSATNDNDIKAAIADEAKSIVTGARRSAYGTPEDNFERIARFWQAYFENTGRPRAAVTAADVSPLMRLMKEARLCETPAHRDSFVDLVGYALTGAEINGVAA